MPTTGASAGQAELLPQRLVGRPRTEPLHVDAVGDHADLRRRAAFVRRQVAAVRFGHGDKGVGDRGQQAIGKLHAVGPAGRVQGGSDHRHAGQAGRQAAPEHLVAGADGDDRVDPPPPHQPRQTPEHAHVGLAGQEAMMRGDLQRQRLAQGARDP